MFWESDKKQGGARYTAAGSRGRVSSNLAPRFSGYPVRAEGGPSWRPLQPTAHRGSHRYLTRVGEGVEGKRGRNIEFHDFLFLKVCFREFYLRLILIPCFILIFWAFLFEFLYSEKYTHPSCHFFSYLNFPLTFPFLKFDFLNFHQS